MDLTAFHSGGKDLLEMSQVWITVGCRASALLKHPP